jgi:hypothetical protein
MNKKDPPETFRLPAPKNYFKDRFWDFQPKPDLDFGSLEAMGRYFFGSNFTRICPGLANRGWQKKASGRPPQAPVVARRC